MADMKKLTQALLFTAAAAMAQFNATLDPIALQNNDQTRQNRTITATENYDALSHAGMAIGLIDEAKGQISFTTGLYTQKLATENDSSLDRSIGILFPRLQVGIPGTVVWAPYYGITPLTHKTSTGYTLKMPFHRFGMTLATQAKSGAFRFGLNLDGFGGVSGYEETSDSGRATLGFDKSGISFGASPHKLFSFDVGAYTSLYMDSLFGISELYTDLNGVQKQVRQERMGDLILPQITTNFRIGDTSVPMLSTFDFTFAKKNFAYAWRRTAGLGTLGYVVNDNVIVTDSIAFHTQNRVHIKAVPSKFDINPSLEFGFNLNNHKYMNPGDDNWPLFSTYKGEVSGSKWKSNAFVFGGGLDFTIISCVDYWAEYNHTIMNLKMTGENYTQDDQKHGYNRFATGAELAIHDLPGIKFPKAGKLYADLSFLTQTESAIYHSYYGSEQFKHLNDLTQRTQEWHYQPWDEAQNEVKTNDFSFGARGSIKDELFDIAGRVHFVNQTMSDTTGDLPKMKGPRFDLTFTYNRMPIVKK